jgi:hypothetical protein
MPLSSEATNTLYANSAGQPLAEQLQSAYDRNVTEGRVVSDSLASVASAAVAAAELDNQAEASLESLTERQRSVAESLLEQVGISYRGLEDTVNALNTAASGLISERIQSMSEVELEEQLETTIMDWADRGILDYVADKRETNPDLEFTLVATPIPDEDQWPQDKPEAVIQAGFKEFAAGQPNPTTDYIYDDYCRGYSREDICGELSSNNTPEVSLSLVPTSFSSEVPTAVISDQQQALLNLQDQQPDLGFHVSSPLTQLTRLYTLREQQQRTDGEPLKGSDLTLIRNFDLPVVVGRVPCSDVDDGGDAGADRDDARHGDEARVAVG